MRSVLLTAVAVWTLAATAGAAQDMRDMPGMGPATPTPAAPTPAKPEPVRSEPAKPNDQVVFGDFKRPPASSAKSGPDAMPGMDHDMPGMDRGMGHDMGAMTGALGAYPMSREASGTSWQPDASEHLGVHSSLGAWSLMTHATLNAVYDRQQGPRGGAGSFVSGMVMLAARRDFANLDSLNLRAMVSPDPWMGKQGYPLLLASGETANGTTPLIDRQHPHDLFMELSAAYAHRLSEHDSGFLYGGLPGEPAFGPPAFMHRLSVMDSPEAPISHHWLDSTHITFGVLTAGWIHDDWKLELSRFRGREPDQHRFDLEAPKLDSTAVRVSWNPGPRWSLQGSWADQKSPEQLDPADDQRRWSASAIYTASFGDHGWWSTTAAWGRRQSTGGPALNAWVLESAVKANGPWTVFGRVERTRTDELFPGLNHGPVETVSKLSIGAVHDWRVREHVAFGLGGLYAFNFVPGVLATSYGSSDPQGAMAFVRIKID